MAEITVKIDDAHLRAFLGWEGPFGHSFERLGREATWRAQLLANKRTGLMASKMDYKRGKWARGLQLDVGTDVPYAYFVHEGTKPHKIRARWAPALVFFWPRVGRVVAFQSVNHPGTRPYRFLTQAVERAMRMWERGG